MCSIVVLFQLRASGDGLEPEFSSSLLQLSRSSHRVLSMLTEVLWSPKQVVASELTASPSTGLLALLNLVSDPSKWLCGKRGEDISEVNELLLKDLSRNVQLLSCFALGMAFTCNKLLDACRLEFLEPNGYG